MEITRSTKRLLSAASLSLVITACSTIHENNDVDQCTQPDGILQEATTDPRAINYRQSTDPAILSAIQLSSAEQQQKTDSKGWNRATIRSQVVGIGEVACVGDNGQIYLTTEGTKLSREQFDAQPENRPIQ